MGEVNPPVVKRRNDTAKEKIKISKVTLEEIFMNFFLTKNEISTYAETNRPEI
jgi:hypothetical protein